MQRTTTHGCAQIIAMGFPSTGSEGLFRNPMPEVQRFFRLMHGKGKALIINLCIERWYDASYFDGHCLRMPFSDHNVSCPLAAQAPIAAC